MGLSDNVVILLCILGAAVSVIIGFAFQRLFGKADPEAESFNKKHPSQEAYMREVRERNIRAAFGDATPQRYQAR